MISDCVTFVWQSTHTQQCTHEQCKSSDYNQVILVHVVHRPTPETCDSEDIKDGQRAHTIYGTPLPPNN